MVTTLKKNAALVSIMGRPTVGVLGSFSIELQTAIEKLREKHPAWGAKSIYYELASKSHENGLKLPCISRIAAFLKDKGYTEKYDRHRHLPTPALTLITRCHQTWQIDDQGAEYYEGVGWIRMINIKDVFSHIYVGTFPVLVATKDHSPTTSDYQCALRLAFALFGMPEHIQSDNGSIFHENRSTSSFPTRFHLWLVAMGITFSFARLYQPTDQAAVERSHRTMFNQIARKESFKNWQHFFEFVQQRRNALNLIIPCQTLNKPPLVAFPQAIHSSRYYLPQKEFELLDLERVYTFLNRCEWFRMVAPNHNISLGGELYAVKEAMPKQQLRVTFDCETKNLMFHNDKELIAQKSIKAISKEIVAGQNHTIFNMPFVQLALPFDWDTIKLSTTL
jgi:transposase InsO family protein